MEPLKRLDRSVKGRAVLITGAASGMGRATAHLFASEGALVAITDINEAGVACVVEEIAAVGGTAHGWRLDVSDAAEIKRVVAEVAARFGRLDILINNAGFGGLSPLDSSDYDSVWDRTITGLLTGQQRMVRAALVHLRKSDAARIVNIASTEGLGATPGDSPYAVAKTGIIGLTRCLLYTSSVLVQPVYVPAAWRQVSARASASPRSATSVGPALTSAAFRKNCSCMPPSSARRSRIPPASAGPSVSAASTGTS